MSPAPNELAGSGGAPGDAPTMPLCLKKNHTALPGNAPDAFVPRQASFCTPLIYMMTPRSTAVGKLMAKMQQVGAGQASKSRYKRFIKNSWNARCCLSHPGKSSPARVGLLRRQTKIAPLVLFFDRRITISSSSLRLTLHYYYTVRADTWR